MTNRLNLVTGAMGFSGAWVVKELLAAGERVIATDLHHILADPERQALLAQLGLEWDHPRLEWVAADLLEPQSLAFITSNPITHLYHTASLYDYSASLHTLKTINLQGTTNLLNALPEDRLHRFIHWSTCGIFGKPYTAAHKQKSNIPFTEESSSPKSAAPEDMQPRGTHLVNAYSVSKWEQEKLIWQAHRTRGLPVTVLRPAPIYGPGSNYGHGGIIIAIARGFLPAIPASAKHAITTSVHVKDMARFAHWIAHREEGLGEDYNIVDNSIISYYEFLHYIALLVGRKMWDIPLLPLSYLRVGGWSLAHIWTWLEKTLKVPRVRILEIQSAVYIGSSYWISNRKSLSTGFTYSYPDVREGLKDTVNWFRDVGWVA